MESSGLVAAKFCWKLSSSDTKSDELTLPTGFHLKYAHRLLETVDLRLRNGYVLPLKLDKIRGVLSGFLVFFINYELKGGEVLVFEYSGQYHINAHILSANGSEMRYPKKVGQMELCYPPLMTLGEDGWRFVKFQSEFDCTADEIKPPEQFLTRCEFALPEEIIYVISNGKAFHGSYSSSEKKFQGLSKLCQIVGVSDLSGFEMMLFEYQVPSTVNISVFDEFLAEITFPGTPVSIDGNGHFPSISSSFEIVVEEKHFAEHCYFVEIPNKFRELVKRWNKFHNIFVHSENGCWMLHTFKRDDYFCRTIESGWKQLCEGLNLNVGNVCIFECAEESYEHFSVRVLAASGSAV